MKEFQGKLAVVTGGGTGMGRELAVQLAKDGCHVAMCDVREETMQQAAAACAEVAPAGTRITTHLCDVSQEDQVIAFRDAVAKQHDTDHIHLLFNNAGIGGGGSFITESRESWEKVFGVCWYGVYYCTRAFLPMLIAADEAHLVNTSSVNGFWATIGPDQAHTAYSAAKFAVKGFSEALVNDFRLNAPHVKVSVVMPGHIGTSIVENSMRAIGITDPATMTAEQLQPIRKRVAKMGVPAEALTDDVLRSGIQQRIDGFRDNAPMGAAEAAAVMIDAVRDERWRVLVGKDAEVLDRLVREQPEQAYERDFYRRLAAAGGVKIPGS